VPIGVASLQPTRHYSCVAAADDLPASHRAAVDEVVDKVRSASNRAVVGLSDDGPLMDLHLVGDRHLLDEKTPLDRDVLMAAITVLQRTRARHGPTSIDGGGPGTEVDRRFNTLLDDLHDAAQRLKTAIGSDPDAAEIVHRELMRRSDASEGSERYTFTAASHLVALRP
jgi:hypothetical protein